MNGHDQLRVLVCPLCGKVGTLDLCTRMVAPPTGTPLVINGDRVLAREVDALVCTARACDFYRLSTLNNAYSVPISRA